MKTTDLEATPERESPTEVIAAGNHPALVAITFKSPCPIEGRKPGVRYLVDSALAAHFVKARRVADYADANDSPNKPPSPQDRAMKPPPRGAGAAKE
jgi:hypothetical protein